MRSDGKYFRVTFRSNDRLDGTGFRASYEFEAAPTTESAVAVAAGGKSANSYGATGKQQRRGGSGSQQQQQQKQNLRSAAGRQAAAAGGRCRWPTLMMWAVMWVVLIDYINGQQMTGVQL